MLNMPQFAPMPVPISQNNSSAATTGLLPQLYLHAVGPVGTAYYERVFTRFETLGRTPPTWNHAAAFCTLGWCLLRGLWRPAALWSSMALLLAVLMWTGAFSALPRQAQVSVALLGAIVLCGVRDVRDYRMHQEGAEVITGGSAFNIKAESLRMGNFTPEETQALWLQHTQATGQVFDAAIFPELWADTEGQPWLVNALGHEVTWKNKAARVRSRPISLVDYQQARERLIYSRATHLDQLSDKLREPRVRSVMSAIIGSKDELQPGDIILFNRNGRGRVSHAGIYLGDDQFIHSSSSRSGGVRIDSLENRYWKASYMLAKRILPEGPQPFADQALSSEN